MNLVNIASILVFGQLNIVRGLFVILKFVDKNKLGRFKFLMTKYLYGYILLPKHISLLLLGKNHQTIKPD